VFCYEVVHYERGLQWKSLFWKWSVTTDLLQRWSVMNMSCYECGLFRVVCYVTGRFCLQQLYCTKDKPAEIPKYLKQLERIQTDSNQSKFNIKSAGSQKTTSLGTSPKSWDEIQDTSKITSSNTIRETPKHLKYLISGIKGVPFGLKIRLFLSAFGVRDRG